MLLLKRLFTAMVLFVVFFVAFLIFGAIVLGIVGSIQMLPGTTGSDFNSSYAVGQEMGTAMGKKYGWIILLGSTGASGAVSLAVSFSGLFPWCREKTA